jgi:indolepyruvate ferredoxin oxidoreductase alpha subunit
MDKILSARSGSKVLLLGNEAVARGALEAGVSVATTYPGTPASEIGDTLARVAAEAGIYFEY